MGIISLYSDFHLFHPGFHYSYRVSLQFPNNLFSFALSDFQFSIFFSSDRLIFLKHRFYHLTSLFKCSHYFLSAYSIKCKLCRPGCLDNLPLFSWQSAFSAIFFSISLHLYIYSGQSNFFSVLRFFSCCSLNLNPQSLVVIHVHNVPIF